MEVVIIGNGGHSKVIQDMITQINRYEVIAILDDKYEMKKIDNGTIYANLSYFFDLLKYDVKFVIAIGSNEIRKMIFEKINLSLSRYLTIIHPTAVVSSKAIIGSGTVIMPQAVVNTDTVVGSHCIINSGAIIEHGNVVGNFSHVSPNATLTGNVMIGEGVHIGASATVIPEKRIGNWSVIGAGSTVIQNIPSNSRAVGSPTRLLKDKHEKIKNQVVEFYDKT